MRIAVIGAGRMGAIRAEDLISGGAEVTIFNRRDNVANELAKKLNCSSADYADRVDGVERGAFSA
jgi:myo-inositol 2-dehydrogenase/D-chiro-inositol 1-dehydrogenase